LATVDESPTSDNNEREKDSNQTERIEGANSAMIEEIPFTRERWLFLRVSHGMHEMEKCESLCFRAHQNPLCSAFKRVLELSRKEAMLGCKWRTIRRKGLRQFSLCIQH
jgi:hypothetical protein